MPGEPERVGEMTQLFDPHADMKPALWFCDANLWQVVQKSLNLSICTLKPTLR